MKKVLLIFLVVCGLTVSSANAELTYNELVHSYKEAKGSSNQPLDNYLIGLYEGISSANLAYYMQSKEFLICKPQGIDLNVGDIRRIIKDSHETFDPKSEIPVSYLLFIGLRKTFPCL